MDSISSTTNKEYTNRTLVEGKTIYLDNGTHKVVGWKPKDIARKTTI
jgi:hypothetical protein